MASRRKGSWVAKVALVAAGVFLAGRVIEGKVKK
jgi:hypothetical protein